MNWKGGVSTLDQKKYKREKMAEYVRIRPVTYKAIAQKAARKFHLKSYGLSPTEFDALFSSQGGRCAICRTALSWENGHDTKPHIDHDHETQKVREILCGSCNRGIAGLQENPSLLRVAAMYLEKHGRK